MSKNLATRVFLIFHPCENLAPKSLYPIQTGATEFLPSVTSLKSITYKYISLFILRVTSSILTLDKEI